MSLGCVLSRMPIVPAFVGISLVLAGAMAQDQTVAFTGARIIPISGDEIVSGTLLIKGGKITAVGATPSVQIPPDAQRVNVAGKVILPGLVDTHNHIGGIGGADGSAPIQPDVRVFDSLNPFDAGFRRALAGGLTTLNIMPGSGHLMSGQTVYVKLRAGAGYSDSEIGRATPGVRTGRHSDELTVAAGTVPPVRTIEDMFIRDADGKPMGGMKMANGTNSFRSPPFSSTRAKSAALVREHFIRAVEYRDKVLKAAGDPEKMPARDIGMEAMLEILDGKRIVHHHTHRADDIMTVLRLRQEFGFRVVLHHVSEAWKVADQIAKAGVPCSIILVDSPGGKLEAAEITHATGGILERAGAKVAIHTDDWINDSRFFIRCAALAVRAGMSRSAALRALTLSGAEQLDLQDRIGSLDPGKDADFVILSGDPLSVYSKVEQTWVEGRKVFDLSNPADRLHAVGGYGAGRDQQPYFCCFDHADGE